MSQVTKFCKCIKSVRNSVKMRPGQPRTPTGKERAAIAICVKSMLQTKGRTLRKFKCRGKKPYLKTQTLRNR